MCDSWQLSSSLYFLLLFCPHLGKLVKKSRCWREAQTTDQGRLPPGPPPDHDKTLNQSPLHDLSSWSQTCLGAFPALCRKPPSLSIKSLHTVLVHLWCQFQPVNPIGCCHMSLTSVPRSALHLLCLCHSKKTVICEIKGLPMVTAFFLSSNLATSGRSLRSGFREAWKQNRSTTLFQTRIPHLINRLTFLNLKIKAGQGAHG